MIPGEELWKSTADATGGQLSVLMTGTVQMLVWCASSWDMQEEG